MPIGIFQQSYAILRDSLGVRLHRPPNFATVSALWKKNGSFVLFEGADSLSIEEKRTILEVYGYGNLLLDEVPADAPAAAAAATASSSSSSSHAADRMQYTAALLDAWREAYDRGLDCKLPLALKTLKQVVKDRVLIDWSQMSQAAKIEAGDDAFLDVSANDKVFLGVDLSISNSTIADRRNKRRTQLITSQKDSSSSILASPSPPPLEDKDGRSPEASPQPSASPDAAAADSNARHNDKGKLFQWFKVAEQAAWLAGCKEQSKFAPELTPLSTVAYVKPGSHKASHGTNQWHYGTPVMAWVALTAKGQPFNDFHESMTVYFKNMANQCGAPRKSNLSNNLHQAKYELVLMSKLDPALYMVSHQN